MAAKEALDVLDQHPLETESRRVLLRIHLERTTQEPHQIRLPLEQPARKEQLLASFDRASTQPSVGSFESKLPG